MSISEISQIDDILAKVRTWTPEMRLNLAEELFRSLRPEVVAIGSRGVPASQVRGIAAGKGLPPDDDTVEQWIHEQRMEKHA